jgi:cyclic pyranopterin phosphate synthase
MTTADPHTTTVRAPAETPRPGLPDRLGRPLRDLRVSVTDRCNFRCPYCMPADVYGESYRFLPRPELLTFEEIERLARIFAGLGTEKVRITGGEPLLRHELPELVSRLARIEGIRDLTLTTNGFLLARHARALADAGLDRVTVSLDSLDPEVFRRMSGRDFGPERVLEGIEAAAAAGLSPVKINCMVQRGVNEDGLVAMARRFRGTGHVLRFIEYMDVGTLNGWSPDEVVSGEDVVKRIDAVFPLEAMEPAYPGEVARRWAYRDGAGEIGVITSVTRPFCGGCTRARLTIEGRLVTCLFAAGGVDLRGPLREGADDGTLRDLVEGTWRGRADRYSEERAGRRARGGAGRRIEMYQLGG